MIESKQAYGHDSMISLVEDWAPPQPEQRRCPCGTNLSRYNPNAWCFICMGKFEKEMNDTTAQQAKARKTKG